MANYTGYKIDTLSKDPCLYVGYISGENKVTDLYVSFNKEDIENYSPDTIIEIPLVDRPSDLNPEAIEMKLIKESDGVVLNIDDIDGNELFSKKLDGITDIEKDEFFIYFLTYHGYFERNFMKNIAPSTVGGIEIDETLFSEGGDCYISYKCYNQNGIDTVNIDLSLVNKNLAFYSISIQ